MAWFFQPWDGGDKRRLERLRKEEEVAASSIAKWRDRADQVDLRILGTTRLVYASRGKLLKHAPQLEIDVESGSTTKESLSFDMRVVKASREGQTSTAPLKDRPLELAQLLTHKLQGEIKRPRDVRPEEKCFVTVRSWAMCGGMKEKGCAHADCKDRNVVWWYGTGSGVSFFLSGNVENFIVPPANLLSKGGAPIRWDPSYLGGAKEAVSYLTRSARADGDIPDEEIKPGWASMMECIFTLPPRHDWHIEEGWYDFLFRCDDAEVTSPEEAERSGYWHTHPADAGPYVSLIGSPIWVARAEELVYGWYHIGLCHAECDQARKEGFTRPAGYYAERDERGWTGKVGLYCRVYEPSEVSIREFNENAIPAPDLSTLPAPNTTRPRFDYWITKDEAHSRQEASCWQRSARASAIEILRMNDPWEPSQHLLPEAPTGEGIMVRIARALRPWSRTGE